MLEFNRKLNESVIICDSRASENITVSVVEIRPDKVRLGIEAPLDIPVHRSEIYDFIRANPQDFQTIPVPPVPSPAPQPLPAPKTIPRKKPRDALASARQKLRQLKKAVEKLEGELDARVKNKKSLTQLHLHLVREVDRKIKGLGQRMDAALKRITKKK